MSPHDHDAPLITVREVGKTFRRRRRENTVLTGIDLDIHAGETLALVGESGSGKTTLARIVVGLTEPTEGQVLTLGEDLRTGRRRASAQQARTVQMVFQDPYASMNPRMRIRDVIAEGLITHRRGELGVAGIRAEVSRLLESVDLDPALARRFPHECSGGQRQRIAIARALALEPQLLVLDEPTSALDVSVQATILDLLRELQERTGVAYLFVSHDLAVVSGIADRVAVMADGRIEEIGPCREVLSAPSSAVTRRLLDSIAHPDPRRANPAFADAGAGA
ncbi:dipeptide/oligopeptide/nickel ABC transporter ATP-binding protein [Brachybacterium sp. P6-10-X1]|uniref:ABC transporter ATP-binding protein n=1 Tax=Brachybacterium sp. P6-10-X1 TaxID=1903186 RepID=UPI00097196C7|nr:dipeptide/oligopeptide/nickel ABC transporter ATP-binding protein [Brachybacterium sp. P6-10-X1]APX33949.1 dipeptide/oligopeptide/nickel ABC transporter ATP-binding protein [Brachybacterium sp. P6-10-X1]